LAPGKDPMRLGGHGTLGEKERTKEGKGNFPDTAVDYNILSNLPFKDQHWATKERRPRMKEKSPRIRKRPAFLCKDFDIVTNRYLDNHSEKLGHSLNMFIFISVYNIYNLYIYIFMYLFIYNCMSFIILLGTWF
jgi:hypothetical protein